LPNNDYGLYISDSVETIPDNISNYFHSTF